MPMEAAVVIAVTIARATIGPRRGSLCQSIAAQPATIPQAIPMIKPIFISLKRILLRLLKSTRPTAKPRIIMEEDCMPTFPPIAVMTGIKVISASTSCNVILKSHIK